MTETDRSSTRRKQSLAMAEPDDFSKYVRGFDIPKPEGGIGDPAMFRAMDELMAKVSFAGQTLLVTYGSNVQRAEPLRGQFWPIARDMDTRVVTDFDKIDAREVLAKVLGRARRAVEAPVVLAGFASIGRATALLAGAGTTQGARRASENTRMGQGSDEPIPATTASFAGVVVATEPGDEGTVPAGVWVDIEHDDGERERALYATDEFPPSIAAQILAGNPFRVLQWEHAAGETIISAQKYTLVQATALSDAENKRRARIAAAATALLADPTTT